MDTRLHQGDLPDGLVLGPIVAIDTETMGLKPERDRLCLIQMTDGNGVVHVVQRPMAGGPAPNLTRLLADPATEKLFHFARFDVAVLLHNLGVVTQPIWCTKIASRLVRTYTDRHGLKDLCKELLGVDLKKEQQSSDWGAPVLTADQLSYAASDVLHLHALRERLRPLLEREGRLELAEACFRFLPWRARLDLMGYPDGEGDVLHH